MALSVWTFWSTVYSDAPMPKSFGRCRYTSFSYRMIGSYT